MVRVSRFEENTTPYSNRNLQFQVLHIGIASLYSMIGSNLKMGDEYTSNGTVKRDMICRLCYIDFKGEDEL